MEDQYIKMVRNAIRSIKFGTKKPDEVGSIVSTNLNKLKPLNIGMFEELMNDYKAVVKAHNEKK